MEDTAAANDEFIKIVSIGKSYEGREMNVIEIRKAGEGKPNVWIEAGRVKNICKLSAAIELILNVGGTICIFVFLISHNRNSCQGMDCRFHGNISHK